ncbi:hypothetical protein SNE40_019166 [Patella caerulea]|uniref:Acidic mammalian chitinase n=2 Tax=Patella caerulea TaxID=87958 RepID=A0AAN8PEQ3_PATCE
MDSVRILLFIGLAMHASLLASGSQYKVVCYHSNWSRYRPYPGTFTEANIDPFLCTHLIYAFGVFDDNGNITPHELDWEFPRYVAFNEVKLQNPNLRTLLAIGGWNFGSIAFSNMASDPVKRKNFVDTSISLLREYNFDGLDMDWEYPVQRGGVAEDKVNFVTLCKELFTAYTAEAASSGKTRLLLTAAVPASRANIQAGYDVPELNKYLDFFNLMTYDFHGGWDSTTGHNSPLYASPYDTGDYAHFNMNDTAAYWHEVGVPKTKVIVGLATYGRSFTLSSTSSFGVNAPATTGPSGTQTREDGFMSYYEICNEMQNGGSVIFDETMQVPYYVNGNVWVGYDDENSLTIKANMIADNQYGGMMVWAIALDDFNHICPSSSRTFPLIKAASEVLNPTGAAPPVDPVVTGNPTVASATTTTTTTTVAPAADSSNTGFCANRADGFYANPTSCASFYNCHDGQTYLTNCAAGTLYDENKSVCDLESTVTCSI